MNKKGLFVVLYGPEGVGKSKQAKLLEEKLVEMGRLVRTVRFPVYDNESGRKLDDLIHGKSKPLPEEQMQELFAKNRAEFEPTLKSWLANGVTVIGENYKGTGLAWGGVRGIAMERMEEMNEDSLEPDIAIYIDGPKRGDSYAPDHPYGDEDEWYRLRQAYLTLADKHGWIRVQADEPNVVVANRIWAIVRPVVVLG